MPFIGNTLTEKVNGLSAISTEVYLSAIQGICPISTDVFRARGLICQCFRGEQIMNGGLKEIHQHDHKEHKEKVLLNEVLSIDDHEKTKS